MKLAVRLAGTLALSATLLSPVFAAQITGAGATFPYPLYAKWADTYKKSSGNDLNYQSIGSGSGIKQIKEKTVDFGASDMPLKPEELNKAGLMQFPTVIGGAVPIVNIPGVATGQLKLTGPLLADIYLGKVKRWNDPAIAKLNPGLKLPALNIAVVRRADASGTSFLFTNYLSKVSPEWAKKVGANTAVNWPTGFGGKGNEGVASNVRRVKGAIGYVEYAYAKQNRIAHASLQNASGVFVQPSINTFRAAAANADWSKAPGFYLILTNQSGKDSWPISGATFILIHKKQDKAQQGVEVLKFFDWAYSNGDTLAQQLDYVPMPAATKSQIRTNWKQVTDASGKALRK